jgi:cytochrome c-type biogenesis protein CcmH
MRKQGSSSFLKKRSKRLLCLRQRNDAGHGLDRATSAEAKVFCFFSSEKKIFLALFLACLISTPALAISDPSEMLPNPQQEARAEAIGSQLRCLVCQNESIEDSNAPLARDLRAKVREQIKAGRTDAQIMAWMVARYGNFVRLRPPLTPATFLLYATPILALLAGAAAAWFGRTRQSAPPPPLTQAEQAKLAELSRPHA